MFVDEEIQKQMNIIIDNELTRIKNKQPESIYIAESDEDGFPDEEIELAPLSPGKKHRLLPSESQHPSEKNRSPHKSDKKEGKRTSSQREKESSPHDIQTPKKDPPTHHGDPTIMNINDLLAIKEVNCTLTDITMHPNKTIGIRVSHGVRLLKKTTNNIEVVLATMRLQYTIGKTDKMNPDTFREKGHTYLTKHFDAHVTKATFLDIMDKQIQLWNMQNPSSKVPSNANEKKKNFIQSIENGEWCIDLIIWLLKVYFNTVVFTYSPSDHRWESSRAHIDKVVNKQDAIPENCQGILQKTYKEQVQRTQKILSEKMFCILYKEANTPPDTAVKGLVLLNDKGIIMLNDEWRTKSFPRTANPSTSMNWSCFHSHSLSNDLGSDENQVLMEVFFQDRNSVDWDYPQPRDSPRDTGSTGCPYVLRSY